MRHGPHHSAQKSTRTGSVDLSTSCSQADSDVCTGAATLVSSRKWPGRANPTVIGQVPHYTADLIVTLPRPLTLGLVAVAAVLAVFGPWPAALAGVFLLAWA